MKLMTTNRRTYYASRNWQLRRQALALRSKGKCENCRRGKYEVAHHLSYAHFGAERINELRALCKKCHAYLHGFSDIDPVKEEGPQQLFLDFMNSD